MSVNREWLFVRSNVRRLRRAADDAAEKPDLDSNLKNSFLDLENALANLERALRRYDAA
jgi:hypothetical protein